MASSLLTPMRAIARGESIAGMLPLRWHDGASVTTVVAAEGYPGRVRSGDPITVPADGEDVTVFHAGTRTDAGTLVTAGGRVVAVTALAPMIAEAQRRSAAAAAQVTFRGAQFRRDIGWRELARGR